MNIGGQSSSSISIRQVFGLVRSVGTMTNDWRTHGVVGIEVTAIFSKDKETI